MNIEFIETMDDAYLRECVAAAKRQNLYEFELRLEREQPALDAGLDQTGGFCMCVRIDHRTEPSWVWVTEDQAYPEPHDRDGEFFMAAAYDDDEDCEGHVLIEGATYDELLPVLYAWRFPR